MKETVKNLQCLMKETVKNLREGAIAFMKIAIACLVVASVPLVILTVGIHYESGEIVIASLFSSVVWTIICFGAGSAYLKAKDTCDRRRLE
jgi:hypothetical protein